MNYGGRTVDPIALWGEYVDFPHNADLSGEFSPLVQCPHPEHQSDKRHFQINLRKPWVHCFSGACQFNEKGWGTYEKALAVINGWYTAKGKPDEKKARKLIKQHSRIALGSTSKRKISDASRRARSRDGGTEKAAATSVEYTRYLPAVGIGYLAARGIGDSGISLFEIGWDQEERRIVVPAKDEKGVLRFLIRRSTRPKDWPKYLYSEGFPKTSLLFGACNLDREAVRSTGLVLCEGPLDCIKLQQFGVQGVAILGARMSIEQARIISKLRPAKIIFMFDKDASGVHTAEYAATQLTKYPIRVALYPKEKKDPADLSRKEVFTALEKAIPYGAFQRRLRQARRPHRKREVTHG